MLASVEYAKSAKPTVYTGRSAAFGRVSLRTRHLVANLRALLTNDYNDYKHSERTNGRQQRRTSRLR